MEKSKFLGNKRGRGRKQVKKNPMIKYKLKPLSTNKNTENNKNFSLNKTTDEDYSIKNEINDDREYEDLLDDKDYKNEVDNHPENSLGQLTKNFIQYIKKTGKQTININDLVNKLEVKKRRIYDITNVLQGIGFIEKIGKNEISWVGSEFNNNYGIKPKSLGNRKKQLKTSNDKKILQIKKQKQLIEKLTKQRDELDKTLNDFKEEFSNISEKKEFTKYAYVTFDDLAALSKIEQKELVIVKGHKGTEVSIIDKKDAKNIYEQIQSQIISNSIPQEDLLLSMLKKENHLFFDTSGKGSLSIYKVIDGNVKEFPFSEINQSNYIENLDTVAYHEINNSKTYNQKPVGFNQNQIGIKNNSANNNNNNSNYTSSCEKKKINNIFFVSNDNLSPLDKDKDKDKDRKKTNKEMVFSNNVVVKNEEANIGVFAAAPNASNSQSQTTYHH